MAAEPPVDASEVSQVPFHSCRRRRFKPFGAKHPPRRTGNDRSCPGERADKVAANANRFAHDFLADGFGTWGRRYLTNVTSAPPASRDSTWYSSMNARDRYTP